MTDNVNVDTPHGGAEDHPPIKRRKSNPFSTWKKAKAAADKARRAADRKDRLATQAEEARRAADEAAERRDEAVQAEREAYDALQQALKDDEASESEVREAEREEGDE